MNIFDEIFKKKWDTAAGSNSSTSSLQIREISLNQQPRSQTKKTTGAYKGTSSTPKRKLKPLIDDEPDVVLRRRNHQINSQNEIYNVNVSTRKAPKPISYQHISNKGLLSEKPTISTARLKQAKSIPSLLDHDNIELRAISTRIRGKTGKEHHHHQQSSVHESRAGSGSNPTNAGGTAATAAAVSVPTLPRTASASANLNVLAAAAGTTTKPGAAAPLGKSARGKGVGSRDRLIDGGGDGTNRVAPPEQQSVVVMRGDCPASGETLLELKHVQKRLSEMATEKSDLMLQLEERIDQINELQSEIKVLKIYQDQSVQQLEQKTEESAYLRSKLRDVVHSPLSDSEKQQLLLIDSHRLHNSAPASIAVNVPNEIGDATACPTPEWDKHSSSNVSDVSVACLQDKINQMQETHYSTNEELQATLQELTDLQRQITDLQMHNNRLGDEKNLMFDSLCRQTDRLKETRTELDNLKQLLNTTKDNSDTDVKQQYAEREVQLLDIVQRLEVERDNLRDRQQELLHDLQQLRISNDQDEEERSRLIERVRMLEGSFDAKVAENRQTEQELSQARDDLNENKIEIDRLKDILESARTKIVELEQDRDVSDKSELDELLDAARKEKDSLEFEITHLREQVAKCRNEIDKLREQVSILQEECKVTRNNAKCTQSELDYKVETLMSDKSNLIEQLQRLQEAVGDFEVQNQCLNEDKRQLNGVLSETQRNLSEAEEKLVQVVDELEELKKSREAENEDWSKFKNDLLTSVRVANDFKTEALQDLQKIIVENKGYREKVRQLEIQIEKLKGDASEFPLSRSSIRRSIHVTPRKLEDGVILAQQDDKLKNAKPAKNKEFPNDGNEQKSWDNKNKSSSKSKETKIKKIIVPENKRSKKMQTKIDDLPQTMLPESLQELNTIFSDPQTKSLKQSKGHERSASNVESQSPSKISDVDLPRKASFDIPDTKIRTGILQPFKPNKNIRPRGQSKTTKSLQKLLTEADAQKFKILGDLLAHIDHTVPIHLLSEEDRTLLKLKSFYDSREMYRHKPIARKPKHELCISNPLMNSVFANPALKKIAEDPNLPTVEPIPPKLESNESFYFSRKQSRRYNQTIESATMLEDGLPERHAHRQTYSTFKPLLNKSQSVSNLCEESDRMISDEEMSLKRYLTEEDLSRNFVIAPSDSKLSLNLWTGTYTFSKQPKHRSDSESSYDSDTHVYTVNEHVNRSTSFVYESPQESLDRRNHENYIFGSSQSLGSINLSSHAQVEPKKAAKGTNKKAASDTDLETSGRFRKFVGGLFGSKENLSVIHEARNNSFASKPEVIMVEAEVHHSQNTLQRPSSSILYYEITNNDQKDEFERSGGLEDVGVKLDEVIYQNIHTLESAQQDYEDKSSVEDTCEVQEKNLYLDYEDDDLPGREIQSEGEDVISNSRLGKEEKSKGESFNIDPIVIRKTTDSLRKHHALAESLCRSNCTEDEIKLVQKVLESNEDSLSRPQSDINNDDIIVIEWIDYCNQCQAVGTIALSLDEYSREIKNGRSISELDKATRRSTELNEQVISLRKQANDQVLDTKRKMGSFLTAESTTDFLDQENFELLENFARAPSKMRAPEKLDALEQRYSIKEDLDKLTLDMDIRKINDMQQDIGRTTSEDDSTKQIDAINRGSKDFHYVEDLMTSWKSKTRRKMRSSIESAGFDLHGPILSNSAAIYENVEATNVSGVIKEVFVTNKAPRPTPRSIDDLIQTGTVSLPSKSQEMADDIKVKDVNSDNLPRVHAADTVYHLPTLEVPNPPTIDDVDKEIKTPNNTPKVQTLPVEYPTLERVAVSHVLTNNLPVFGRLNDCMKDEQQQRDNAVQDGGSASSTLMKKSSLEQTAQFQIHSIRKDSFNEYDSLSRKNFIRARNKFLQSEEERASSRDNSPRGSFRKQK